MARGKFITLEGGEGAGKTTQSRLLVETLNERGIDAINTREPGGSTGAEEIRALLVQGERHRWDALTELLLHFAARRDHVINTIFPALARNEWVICDRFMDSTLAYQIYGQNMDEEIAKYLYSTFVGDLTPDLTLILDVAPDMGIKRALDRDIIEARYEQFGIEFHKNIRENFLRIAKSNPNRYKVIDAGNSIIDTHQKILTIISEKFLDGNKN